jgi:endonuclease YncB( thermonuclease family)
VIKILFALLCLSFPANAKEAAGSADTSSGSETAFTPVKFERVIDGDTFMASSKPITLWGIDAPKEDDPNHLAATLFLETMIDHGNLSCKQVAIDRNQHNVMHCLVDGLDVGSMMVQMSMAAASDPYYKYEQDLAKQEGRGIWNRSLSKNH